ncbi:caf1 family ribonuclease [Pyrenophora seminiperda CCB06]|uniref:Caf1 family ribonuclease n=1 Tax=Pyrenophora seminiperda CCB06 TaxID=1302712 RepID=A0A3M7M0K2_9PLEO|nr:caf1 family ribonuclease [Pyrenophora seminiperda CCB06]
MSKPLRRGVGEEQRRSTLSLAFRRPERSQNRLQVDHNVRIHVTLDTRIPIPHYVVPDAAVATFRHQLLPPRAAKRLDYGIEEGQVEAPHLDPGPPVAHEVAVGAVGLVHGRRGDDGLNSRKRFRQTSRQKQLGGLSIGFGDLRGLLARRGHGRDGRRQVARAVIVQGRHDYDYGRYGVSLRWLLVKLKLDEPPGGGGRVSVWCIPLSRCQQFVLTSAVRLRMHMSSFALAPPSRDIPSTHGRPGTRNHRKTKSPVRRRRPAAQGCESWRINITMDVDADSFPHHLLGLFVNISEADFVSFDLELSGIPSRIQDKPARGSGRLTLEERYAETKMGADRYQILQVGITCARFDYIADKYVLRPYNISISPLLNERLDFEREIRFQTGACTFLLNNGFDLGAPFAKGVQYLSREEAERAKQMAWDRLENKNPVPDLQLKKEDVESLDFMRRIRKAIKAWKTSTSSSLDVTTHTGLPDKPVTPVITRFEKRLVHQLVRAEFPELVTMGRSECVRIINLDPVRETDNMNRIKTRVKESILRQTGFRWIFEALVRDGQVDRADLLYVARTTGMPTTGDMYNIRDRYDRAVERLKTRQPVLVGHNMFTDIVYLYRTFVGELPDTLQGFQDAIHDLFPKIIDTKYLATHAEGDLNASPTLEEIATRLNNQPLPHIVTHADYSKYQDTEAFHEAGYDSLLTATIMIKLAAKLGAERGEEVPAPFSGIPPGITNKLAGTAEHTPDFSKAIKTPAEQSVELVQDMVKDGREKVQKPVPLPPVEKSQPAKTNKRSRNKKGNKKNNKAEQRRFETKNMFDSLRELKLNPETESSSTEDEELLIESRHDSHVQDSQTATWDKHVDAASSWENDVFVQDKTGWVPIEQVKRQSGELIPAFNSKFWSEFGNTLRVFGTEETVLKISDWED